VKGELHRAAQKGDIQLVMQLLDQGAEVSAVDEVTLLPSPMQQFKMYEICSTGFCQGLKLL